MNKSKEEPTSTSFNRKAGCYQYVYLRGKSSKKEKGTTKGAALCSLRKEHHFTHPQKGLHRYSTGQNKACLCIRFSSGVLKIILTWTFEM